MTKPMNGSAKAKKLARRLLRENRRGRVWRDIEKDYPGISWGTLNKIARRGGEWLPPDENSLIILGIKKPKRTGPRLPPWLNPEAADWFMGQREKIKAMSKEMKDEIKRRTR